MKASIYFDSGVLLDTINYRQGYRKVNIKRKFDIEDLNPSKVQILISDISLIELTEHLKDSKASFLAIEEGYSYFDLCKHRIDDVQLSEKDIKEIDTLLEKDLINLPPILATISRGFNSAEITFLVQICKKYSIFFIDALHFLIADREDCEFFVTTDKKLKKSLKTLVLDLSLESKRKILSSKEFKNSMFNTLK